MKTHPARLIILFPIYEPRDYRRCLVAIDDALVVHRDPGDTFLLELRPMAKLTGRGANTYTAALLRLAADLEAGYTVMIVDRDQFLSDLEALAREHAAASDCDAVERAVQVITERTTFQIRDHADSSNSESLTARLIIAARERRTRADPHEGTSLNCMHGIPTPRSEQLWNVLRYEWCYPRANAAARPLGSAGARGTGPTCRRPPRDGGRRGPTGAVRSTS